jgi:hypothetical protein
MLRKLIKYEIKATQRIFLPIFGLILICSLLIKAFFALNYDIDGPMAAPFGITIFVYGLLIAAAFVMTLVVTIERYRKNLLGDEGYLSFTLPVKVHSHIDCKMITSVMWAILSLIVALISIFIIVGGDVTKDDWSNFGKAVGYIFGNFGGWATLMTVEGIVLFLVTNLSFILKIYLSISVGNFSSKHKMLASFGTFVGLSVVENIVFSIAVRIGIKLNIDQWLSVMSKQYVIGSFQTVSAFLGCAILLGAVFGAAYYFLTNWILSKKLNLE